MSLWVNPHMTDIDFDEDEKEIYFYVGSDESGSLYGVLTFEQIKELNEKIKDME